ncbi:MAG TPA: PIN domain-containing protein [Vicinamibacteria bacterium]|nr:PIN domain-containing protein [Vicinamibacteria bacterium]
MPAWILDSAVLIDWFCGREGVAPYVRRVIEGEQEGAFSTISEIELWQGLRPGEEEAHEALLGSLERVPLDRAIARRAGALRREHGLSNLSLAPGRRDRRDGGRDRKMPIDSKYETLRVPHRDD